MGKGIPDRWVKYLPVGKQVAGTKFLPFKVPLKVELCRKLPSSEWFTPEILLKEAPQVKAIIDLTNTNRYYDVREFTRKGVSHKKLMIEGGRSGNLPPNQKVEEFFDAVDHIVEMLGRDSDALIGVHCTHGLNRTGYLICKYMVSRMKIDPQEAINSFQDARGYSIERPIYLNDILKNFQLENKQITQLEELRQEDGGSYQRDSRSLRDYPETYQCYRQNSQNHSRSSRRNQSDIGNNSHRSSNNSNRYSNDSTYYNRSPRYTSEEEENWRFRRAVYQQHDSSRHLSDWRRRPASSDYYQRSFSRERRNY